MGRKKTLVTPELLQLVESDISEIKNSDIVIKLKAIKASYSHKQSDVAEIFDIARSSIERWTSNYKKYGIEGLKNKSRGHNPSKLSEEEKAKIKEWILNGRDTKGKQVHWTLKRLIREIHTVFNKEITKTPLWLTLGALNLSIRKPRPKHYKSNEEEQVEFKKNSRKN